MAVEVGSIIEGKVTGITKFGAFVALPEGKSGLVHISEVADSFVSDVHQHVEMGQLVKVKVLSISPEGKINLSIKKAVEPTLQERPAYRKPSREDAPIQRTPKEEQTVQAPQTVAGPSDDKDFESRLKKFMQESDSRIADNPRYSDRPRRNSRRR